MSRYPGNPSNPGKWQTFPGSMTFTEDKVGTVTKGLPVEDGEVVVKQDKGGIPYVAKYRNESTLADRVKQKVKDKWGKKPTPEELALEAQKEADIKASLAAIEDKLGPMTVSPSDMARQHDYDGHLLPNSGAMEKLKTPRGIVTKITKMDRTMSETKWRVDLTINGTHFFTHFAVTDIAMATRKDRSATRIILDGLINQTMHAVMGKIKEGVMQDFEEQVTKMVDDPFMSGPGDINWDIVAD